MKYLALLPLLWVQQDLPEPIQKAIARELGPKPAIKKTNKEPDGSYLIETKTVTMRVNAAGDLIDKDETIGIDKAPKAVQEAAQKELGGKKLETTKVTKVSYEVRSGNVKLKIDEDGSISRRDESIKPADVPQAVAKSAVAKLEGSSVSKAKKILEDGRARYRVTVENSDKKKVEAEFTEDGTEIK